MEQGTIKKIHVAVIFGGKSAEREVSVCSAQNVIRALDTEKYDITLVSIDKDGAWSFFEVSQLLLNQGQSIFSEAIPVPLNARGEFLRGDKSDFQKIDVVFPVLHGSFGEDGSTQGLLRLANVPFVGSGVLGSAVGMDKDVTKRLLREAGLPVARFLTYRSYERETITFEEIETSLGVPFFVKPANLGSSVGITKVHNKQEYKDAISSAFLYDNKILIEEYIRGREIECAVLGNTCPITSTCGEVISHHEFYSYEAKYLDENGTTLSIPAHIPEHISETIQLLAARAFNILCCDGMARVDFFVTDEEDIFINEINTIPGFTSMSMYPKLWEASGVSHAKLIDTLIELAFEKFQEEQKLHTSL